MQRELLLIREMIDAAKRVQEIIGGLDVAGLRGDTLRRDAILWNYTALGEASSQVPTEVKRSHPSVGWERETRLRNRIVHGYWDLDLHILHDTASEDLPSMIEQLTAVLNAIERTDRDPTDNQER